MVVRREWSLKRRGRINLFAHKDFTVLKKKQQRGSEAAKYRFCNIHHPHSVVIWRVCVFLLSQISEGELM